VTVANVQYTATVGDLLIGEPLTIELSKLSGPQANFDNVRLDASPYVAPVQFSEITTDVPVHAPEPATLALLGTGLVALARARRKSRAK
jgi:hypothetical protein